MSNIDDDIISNPSGNETFDQVVSIRLSRRGFLGGSLAVGAAAALGGIGSLLHAVPAEARRHGSLLGFLGFPISEADAVAVPPGYTARPLIFWGDPLSAGPAFKQDASNTAAEQMMQWGMHNDGVVYFPIQGARHGLLVQNHEYTDDVLLFPDGAANWSQEKTNKSLAAHGVSVIEIKKSRGAGAYSGFGNNQMLCADPVTREIRRFLQVPNVCEITGVTVTPDERTLFVGIQHPGEAPTGVNDPANPKRYSSWPEGAAGGRPRSSTFVITKDDGGRIGS